MNTDQPMQESLRVAEAARESEWRRDSFLRDLFLGKLRLDLLAPYPLPDPERPEFRVWRDKFRQFLKERVDSAQIDAEGEYPDDVLDGLRALGAFGLKIPKEYGGLGFSKYEYASVMKLLGSFDGNLTALLSAHQSIGLPQPLMLFGTEEQKREYLPRCAAGAISAFALTETRAGSDPARLATSAELAPDGRHYILNGAKLWCTNGTIADLLVVMARDPTTGAISTFIVETRWPGVEVVHRSRFMGLKALANGTIAFHDVRVPVQNLIGAPGKGLKIALTTLNTGRLTLPAATVGLAKQCLEISRKWALAREQWGQAIGRHEAITHKLADMAATVYAMEALNDLVQAFASDENFDIRLEAAAAKEWNTTRAWEIVDETLQIRGGRGYETERSLAERGEVGIGVERMLRDSRINRIFEGSSEIMHLFMAREAVDKHLRIAGAMIDPQVERRQRLAALPKIAAFYATWYPTRWLGWGHWPRFASYHRLARHLRFVERSGRRLSREIFHAMMVYQAGTQNKQAFLFRLVDLANELLVMAAAVTRAQRLSAVQSIEAPEALELADLFCRTHSRKVKRLFTDLWRNDDATKYRVGRDVLQGKHSWLEHGSMGLGVGPEDLAPHSVAEVLASRAWKAPSLTAIEQPTAAE